MNYFKLKFLRIQVVISVKKVFTCILQNAELMNWPEIRSGNLSGLNRKNECTCDSAILSQNGYKKNFKTIQY